MSIFHGRIILRKGKEDEFNNASADSYEVGELIFLEDVGKFVIKKADNQFVVVDPNEIKNYLSKKEATALQNNILNSVKDKNYITGYEYTEDGKLQLLSGDNEIGEPIALGTDDKGLSFDSGSVDDNGYLHLTLNGEDIEGFDPFFVGNGGSGSSGGSKLTFSMITSSSFSVADASGTAPVTFNYISVDADSEVQTGNGNLKITVNGSVKKNLTIKQGENTIDIFDYLNIGSNVVKLNITDSYGVSATRTINVTVESLRIEWNLSSTLKNTSNTLSVVLTPYGSGTKKVYVQVDDEEPTVTEVTASGRKITKELTLEHGSHIITAYCTVEVDGVTLQSEILKSAVAQVDVMSDVPVVAVLFSTATAKQYDVLNIKHRVVDNDNNPAEVKYHVNGTLYKTENIDQSEQVWSYRPTTPGTLNLKIECGATTWEHEVEVTALDIGVTEVTENLEIKVEPSTMTSLDGLVLSDNFDLVNGGLITDAEGVRAIKVMKGDRITIPFKMFANDFKVNGKEIKVIYKVDNCSNFNAKAISCKSDGIGLDIYANKVQLNSEQTEATLQTCEELKTELDINISSDTSGKLINIWEYGSPAAAKIYADGDNFAQATPEDIVVGSDDCNVYLYMFRSYSRNLTDTELTANFIIDGKDGIEITDRAKAADIYDSAGNISVDKVIANNPDAHILTFHAPSISVAKTNKVIGSLTHTYTSGGSTHTWTANNVEDKVQGTSSAGYNEGSLNHDFNCKEGFVLDDGTVIAKYAMTDNSIPVNYFNFKVNQASSENRNNIILSEWYNKFQPYVRPARQSDVRVRDTVEGHMAILFYHNTGAEPVVAGAITVQPDETILYGVGNLNNSKKNNEVFAHDDNEDCLVIEISNNTADQSRFISDDLSTETWDGETNYEFRYKSDTVTDEEAKQLWQEVLTFVVSCNPAAATGQALDSPETIGSVEFDTDSAEYRKAKFKAEAGNHFEMDSVLYHYLFTLFFSMVDNRAKNTFWAYNKATSKWNLVHSYDHDTALGIDNEGGNTLRAGYLDTDMIGTKAVFNAYDSVIFSLVRETMVDELRTMFIDLENKGCWDINEINKQFNLTEKMICQTLWVEDTYKKYYAPYLNNGTTAYIGMANGTKRLQRQQFLKFQKQFISAYFISSYATSIKGTLRCYTPSEWSGIQPESKMTITPYYDTFVVIKAGSITTKERAYAGQPVEINLGVQQMNDTEVYLYNAEYIQDIGNIACLYPGYCDVAPLIRLKHLNVGSSVEGYTNTNLTEISVNNCKSLETMSIQNCSAYSESLDLTNNIMLKSLNTKGTSCSGVAFANGGKLISAELNNLASVTVRNLYYIQNVSMDSYENLTTIVIENTPYFSTDKSIVEVAANLRRLRLIGIAWELNKADLLMRLYGLAGVNDDGYNTEHAVITGSAHIVSIAQSRIDTLRSYYKSLEVTADTIIPEFTVRFMVDDEVYYSELVELGSSAPLPPNPTKQPTAQLQYDFVGWSGSEYIRVVRDIDVNAIFSETTRKYTVRYLNGTEVLQGSEVEYGDLCVYEGEEPEKPGSLYDGWDKPVTEVTADIDYNAKYIVPELPSYKVDSYTFLASDDETDNAPYTPENIYAICNAGIADQYFNIGDKIKINVLEGTTIKDESIILSVHGFRHFRLADGSKFADVVFGMIGTLTSGHVMNSTNTNVGGWDASNMNIWLNNTVFNALPLRWRRIIKSVQVLASAGDQSPKIKTSIDKLFLFSQAELGYGVNEVPYKNEVDPEAEQVTFPLYTNSTSKIKKTYNGEGTAQNYWLRSPYPGSSSQFVYINSNGGYTNGNAFNAYFVAFGFCV